ncbi:MAG: hypothetical protein Q9207_000010 [Kuettlingeria erythrocarpa]
MPVFLDVFMLHLNEPHSPLAPRPPCAAVSPYGSAAICYTDKSKVPPISFTEHATEVVSLDGILDDASTLCRDKCKQSKRAVMEKHQDYTVKHSGEPKVKTRVYCKVGYSEQTSGRPLDKKTCGDMSGTIVSWCEWLGVLF